MSLRKTLADQVNLKRALYEGGSAYKDLKISQYIDTDLLETNMRDMEFTLFKLMDNEKEQMAAAKCASFVYSDSNSLFDISSVSSSLSSLASTNNLASDHAQVSQTSNSINAANSCLDFSSPIPSTSISLASFASLPPFHNNQASHSSMNDCSSPTNMSCSSALMSPKKAHSSARSTAAMISPILRASLNDSLIKSKYQYIPASSTHHQHATTTTPLSVSSLSYKDETKTRLKCDLAINSANRFVNHHLSPNEHMPTPSTPTKMIQGGGLNSPIAAKNVLSPVCTNTKQSGMYENSNRMYSPQKYHSTRNFTNNENEYYASSNASMDNLYSGSMSPGNNTAGSPNNSCNGGNNNNGSFLNQSSSQNGINLKKSVKMTVPSSKRQILEEEFRKEKYPSNQKLQKLSNKLNMRYEEVQNYFKKRRREEKETNHKFSNLVKLLNNYLEQDD